MNVVRGNKILVLILIFVAIASAIIILPNKSSMEELTEIRIGYRTHVFYLPLFIAVENGYFVEQGLNVTIENFESTNTIVDSLLAGRLDASLSGVNLPILFSIEEKIPGQFKIFTVAPFEKDKQLSAILVKKDSNFTNILSLKNKRLGIFQGSTALLLTRLILVDYNLTTKDLEIIQISPSIQLQALESMSVDAIFVLEPLATIGVEKNIAKIIEKEPIANHIAELPFTSSVTTTKFYDNNRDVVKKLITITNKAIDFIEQNPVESKKILAKYTNLDEGIAQKQDLPRYSKVNEINISAVQGLADLLYREGELKSQINISNLILRLE